MPSALSIIGALTLGALGAAGMYEADRFPVTSVALPIHLPFWHPHLDVPASLVVQRDRAEKAAAVSQEAARTCRVALDAQSARDTHLSALGAVAMAGTEATLVAKADEVRRLRAANLSLLSSIPTVVTPADACVRWNGTDDRVEAALRSAR